MNLSKQRICSSFLSSNRVLETGTWGSLAQIVVSWDWLSQSNNLLPLKGERINFSSFFTPAPNCTALTPWHLVPAGNPAHSSTSIIKSSQTKSPECFLFSVWVGSSWEQEGVEQAYWFWHLRQRWCLKVTGFGDPWCAWFGEMAEG